MSGSKEDRLQDDMPGPPEPEFDRDATYALASPGLSPDERAEIIREARSLCAGGLASEVVGNWICRKVAQVVGARSGFEAHDASGNIVDLPHVAAIRRNLRSQTGQKRQVKRNVGVEQWQQRCRQLREDGMSEGDIWARCWAGVIATYKRSQGQSIHVPTEFMDLPVLFGRDGKSLPRKRRLRERLLAP